MESIFYSILKNWNNITNDEKLINSLDINNNITCKNYKDMYPDTDDKFIQAGVLTQYIILYCIVCKVNLFNDNLFNFGI
jgi:hypothetical protein